MTQMLLYDTIAPLNRDRHRNLRLMNAGGSARFAQHTHYVPLAGTEFYQAARDYPVIFAGGEDDAGPIALLGLRENENLFLEDSGRWSVGSYVPAFVRRYPFILASGGQEGDDHTVCLDEHYAGLSEQEGTPLFDDEGNDTEFLGRTVGFLNQFFAEMQRTRQFSERLQELDLLVRRDLRVSDDGGRNFVLRDFRIVDEAKLAELEDGVVGELHRSGYLGWIHAHLVSLGNAARMPARVAPVKDEQPPVGEAAFEDSTEGGDAATKVCSP